MVQEGRRDAALRRLSRCDARELLDPVEFADQRGKLALAFFVGGEDREALRLARASAREAGDLLPWVRWTAGLAARSEEHTSELQSLMRTSYAVFRFTKKKT